MGRKGTQNRGHTEQDMKAEEMANDRERQTEDIPTPKGLCGRLWIIFHKERLFSFGVMGSGRLILGQL